MNDEVSDPILVCHDAFRRIVNIADEITKLANEASELSKVAFGEKSLPATYVTFCMRVVTNQLNSSTMEESYIEMSQYIEEHKNETLPGN